MIKQFRNPKAVTLPNILFDLMWVVFLLYNILDNSAWVPLSEGWTFTNVFRIIRYCLGAVCLAIIIWNLVHRLYTKQAMIAYLALGIVIAVSAWQSKNYTYIWYFLVFAAAYRQDAKRVVFLTACVTALMLVVIVGTSQIGLSVDFIFNASTRSRHGLGFGWTTTAPILYLFFIFQYLYLRRENMRFFEYLILEAVAVFFYIKTDTNLAFGLSTAILVFFFVEGRFNNRWNFWRRLRWFWVCFPMLICLLTIVMFLLYNREGHLWSSLNSAMHSRLTLGQDGLSTYGLSAFGQPIAWNGYFITATDVANYNYIDCSYLQLLLELGVLFLVSVIAIYTNAMYNAMRTEDYYLVWILVAVLLFSIMEPRLMNLTFNVFPLMAFLNVEQS